MSTYTATTRHPVTGDYEPAMWIDDYFDHHVYGVKFPSDGKVYPTEQVNRKQIYDFWIFDVLKAFENCAYELGVDVLDMPPETLKFLNAIQKEYRERWERDPIEGEGAVDKSAILKKNRK